MPAEAWKRAVSEHYPYRTWIPLHTDTLDRLARLKVARGAPTFDRTLVELMDEGERR